MLLQYIHYTKTKPDFRSSKYHNWEACYWLVKQQNILCYKMI